MTRSSDLVMVERDVLERAHEALSHCYDVNNWPADGTTRQDAALRLLTSALQSVEGGVQGSIATKQESCPESAPRTETEIVAALRECQRVLAMMIDPASIKSTSVIHAFAAATAAEAKARAALSGVTKSDGGVEGHAVNSCHIDPVVRHAHEHDQGRSALSSPPKYKAAGIKPGPSDAQLTKTPSADHDGCICQDQHRRGYCTEPGCQFAPNHQPHAVSQGWRTDLENAPGGVRFLIAGRYPNGIWYVEESYRHYAGHFNGRKIDPPTHWMPLPAPPSPAKTGGAE